MAFFWILEINLVIIVVLAHLVFKVTNLSYNRNCNTHFNYIAMYCMGLAIADSVWRAVAAGVLPQVRIIAFLAVATYKVILAFVSYEWVILSEEILGGEWIHQKFYKGLLFFPFGTLFIMIASSYFNGLVFYIDENCYYTQGPAYILAELTYVVVIIVIVVKALHLHRTTESRSVMKQTAVIFGFAIIVVGVRLITTFDETAPYVQMGIMLALINTYYCLQEHRIMVDDLTDMNNRNALFPYLEERYAHYRAWAKRTENIAVPPSGLRGEQHLYVLIVDVINLKELVKHVGRYHTDEILIEVARQLKAVAAEYGCFVARFSEYRFCFVHEGTNDIEVINIINKIDEKSKEISSADGIGHAVVLAAGYACYDAKIMPTRKAFFDATVKNLEANKLKKTSKLVKK